MTPKPHIYLHHSEPSPCILDSANIQNFVINISFIFFILLPLKSSLVAQLVRIGLQCRRPGFNCQVVKIPWRRERLSTPVFWPGDFHGPYRPWGCKELDTTERISLSLSFKHFLKSKHFIICFMNLYIGFMIQCFLLSCIIFGDSSVLLVVYIFQ